MLHECSVWYYLQFHVATVGLGCVTHRYGGTPVLGHDCLIHSLGYSLVLTDTLYDLSLSPQTYAGIRPQIGPLPLSSTSSAVHYSLIILAFDAILSELVKLSN
jgi:hypothetical protein